MGELVGYEQRGRKSVEKKKEEVRFRRLGGGSARYAHGDGQESPKLGGFTPAMGPRLNKKARRDWSFVRAPTCLQGFPGHRFLQAPFGRWLAVSRLASSHQFTVRNALCRVPLFLPPTYQRSMPRPQIPCCWWLRRGPLMDGISTNGMVCLNARPSRPKLIRKKAKCNTRARRQLYPARRTAQGWLAWLELPAGVWDHVCSVCMANVIVPAPNTTSERGRWFDCWHLSSRRSC
ncbi:hypothetical protein BS50DRAFT_8557 [Corynespora cassiicola Philippines]|uniref:Uncharacterized protein n=1 Tax=Corynespora cassiicola Philippines TaxID=1448308 RepID=A0A2T2P8Z7_CORCC|nr:hypothetical protein BS50DRAFT_8557 [Corynespora cassiicola Philippines]